jgi:hypothetical protein
MRVHLFSRGSSNIKEKEIKKKRCPPVLITAFGEALNYKNLVCITNVANA